MINIETTNPTINYLNTLNGLNLLSTGLDSLCIELYNIITEGNDKDINVSNTPKLNTKHIRTKKYKMFSAEKKKICIDELKNSNGRSIKEIAIQHNIPQYSLKRWAITGPERHKGCGRKVEDPLMVKKLLEWYNVYHGIMRKPVNGRMIKEKALAFSSNKNFRASKGWLEKFKKRHHLNY